MIATLFPSPTLLSVFEDARRGALEAFGAGKEALKARVPALAPGKFSLKVGRALGRLSIQAVVPLIVRDAIEKRRALRVETFEAGPVHVPNFGAVAEPQDLLPKDVTWMRATAPILEAQASAQDVFRLQAEAGEHIDAATYALEGMLGDLKRVMPGIKMRSAKLHKVDFRSSRDAEASDAPIPLRAVRAA